MIKYAQALLRKHRWFIASFQAALICSSLILAWLLRFDYSIPDRRVLFEAASILVLLRLIAIWRFGLLHGWWKYTGASDVLDIMKAVTVGSLAFIITTRYVLQLTHFPRSVYLLEPLLTCGLLIGVRVSSRLVAETVRLDLTSAKPILLIGAGVAAQTVINELKRASSGYSVVGCLDDDPSKAHLKLSGVPVLGSVDQLDSVVERYSPDEILIAVPSATGRQMQRFVKICEASAVKFRTVPALRDVIDGKVAINTFREVRVEDLLGRDPVQIDLDAVKNRITNRVIMVTGAAGSIGSELCRQVLEYEPAALLCVDQNETGIFYLERELSRQRNGSRQHFIVADVGDAEQMGKVFSQYAPEVVFHAAAYKHVPVMESNVATAVSNNVFGLLDLLHVADTNGCKSFVFISSDKAVNPTSTMGATKRLGELIISRRPNRGLRAVAVRFGNVLGSSGSVIPVLQEQLRNGLPITITHPEMKRYFMTIREAVSLVLQAFTIGENGDTLVLDMGEPVSIVELAHTLITLSGTRIEDVQIELTGLRPGEKLIEELFYDDEVVYETSCKKIKKARQGSELWDKLELRLDELRQTLYVDCADSIRTKIKEMIPEYSCMSQTDGSLSVDIQVRRAVGA